MSYEQAEYKYINHMREHYGLIGDIEYPDKDQSRQDPEGNWLLISFNGQKMAKVLTTGCIIT